MIESPTGVGKSVLTVLMCFYLAKECGKPVLLIRKLRGEGPSNAGVVAVHLVPGAYPEVKAVGFGYYNYKELPGIDEKQKNTMYVLDNWTYEDMKGASFYQFKVLAVTGNYVYKSADPSSMAYLPAWTDKDLKVLIDAN